MAQTLGAQLVPHYSQILPVFASNIDDSHSFELVLDTLTALRRIYRAASTEPRLAAGIQNDTDQALALLTKALNHEYAKITAEGLRATASLVHALSATINTSSKGLVAPVFSELLAKLKKADIDQEVKQSSLIAMASVISTAHAQIGSAGLDESVRLFGERLESELTRDSSLKGFTQMASAPQKIPLKNLNAVMAKLLGLLRKNQRTLHVHTFEAIVAFLSRYSEQFSG